MTGPEKERTEINEGEPGPAEAVVARKSGTAKSLAVKITAALTVLLALLVTAFVYAVKFLVTDLNAAGVTVEPSAIMSYTRPLMYMGLSILALVLCAAVPVMAMKGRALRPWVYSLTLSAGFVAGAAFGLLSARYVVQSGAELTVTAREYAILAFSNMLKAGMLFAVLGAFAGLYLNAKKENRKGLGIALLLACVLVVLAYIFFFGLSSGTL